MELEKTLLMNQLFDMYGSLLTDKQQTMLSYYYEEDLSLAEIADHFDISRQGVYDSLKRGENSLKYYEGILQGNEKFRRRMDLLQKLEASQLTDQQSQWVQALMAIELGS